MDALKSDTAADACAPFRCGPADEPQGLKPRRGGLDDVATDIACRMRRIDYFYRVLIIFFAFRRIDRPQ